MPASYPLPGRIALVTGAAQGIGLAAARGLHARGCSVAILDIDGDAAAAAAAALGERTLALSADVTDADAMRAAAGEVTERFGGIDVVIANAGVAPPARPMSVIDPVAFERTLEVDLLGVWRTVQPTLGQVIERRGQVIVVASIYAFMNGVLATPYAVAKAGVEQLGRALRTELSIHGASAGVAYFGFIDTKLVRDAFTDPAADRLERAFPAFMLRRLTPEIAGAAIVDGIEARSARIVRPRWWSAYSTLRGMLNPLLDARSATDPNVREAVALAERLGREDRAAEREPAGT